LARYYKLKSIKTLTYKVIYGANMSKSSQTRQVQVQIQSEEYWRKRLEELGVKFDEFVVEVLKVDFERRSGPYEHVINSISQYLYDVSSKLHGLIDEVNDGGEKRVLLALAKLEDIAEDILSFVKCMRRIVVKA